MSDSTVAKPFEETPTYRVAKFLFATSMGTVRFLLWSNPLRPRKDGYDRLASWGATALLFFVLGNAWMYVHAVDVPAKASEQKQEQTVQTVPTSAEVGNTRRSASTVTGVPQAFVGHYDKAAAACSSPFITGALLAAQGSVESVQFADKYVYGPSTSPKGAKGVAQFTDAGWRDYGNGGNVWNPADAIAAQGRYMCKLATQDARVRNLVHGDDDASVIPLALSAYNAGPNAVRNAGGVPAFKETREYVKVITDRAGFLNGVKGELANKIRQLMAQLGYNVGIASGKREYAEQKTLWNEAVAKYGATQAPNWVANPDEKPSKHLSGEAVDINGNYQNIHAAAKPLGICFPVSNEPWHAEECA